MPFQDEVLGRWDLVAPIVYIGLFLYCAVFWTLFRPRQRLSWAALDIEWSNLRIWGFAGGCVVFVIVIMLHRIGVISVSPIDYVGVRWLIGLFFGIAVGVLLMEAARLLENDVLSAAFVAFVVAGSLSSLYVYQMFDGIRVIFGLGAAGFLFGVIADVIAHRGLVRRGHNDDDSDDEPDDWLDGVP